MMMLPLTVPKSVSACIETNKIPQLIGFVQTYHVIVLLMKSI